MKTIILIIIVIAIAGMIVMVQHSGSHPTTEVSVMRDITEAHLSQPVLTDIMPLFNFDHDNGKWNGGAFDFTNITNVSFNLSTVVELPSANEWLSNEYSRTIELRQFQYKISKVLEDSKMDSVGKGNSSIFVPIANQLNRLFYSNSNKKELLVYSDLMENDPHFSFYDQNNLNQLTSNYERSKREFDKMMYLHDLSGIEIHLLYEPPDVVSDERYRTVSAFYKKYLESKGAKVTISANLTSN